MLATFRTVRTLVQYELSIVPHARREIRKWADVAATIPDPTLRGHATEAISVDASNAEAVAAFAAVAPRRQRRTTVELLVAYQILVDYVDTLGERVCAEELALGLRIGMALTAAVRRPAAPLDLDPFGDDGGYLTALVSACRGSLWRLPAAATVAQPAALAAVFCAHALAYTHTSARHDSVALLREWCERQPKTGYEWWEVAAGGNSSIAILALLATAADPAMTEHDAAAVASAYWPHICVMSTLLDSLIDYERDAASGEFSFVSHYPDRLAVRHGLVAAAVRSLAATRALPHSHAHAMIVCGVAGYYASAADAGLGAQVAPSLIEALRPTATPIAFALRAQRRFAGQP